VAPMRYRRTMRLALLALLAAAALSACGSALGDAKSDFKKGRYPEAREELLRLEPDSRTWDERRRAEYALYRGLTHNALGDRAAAGVWLKEAKAIEDARPGTLAEDDRVRLRLGLESVGPDTAPPSP
jgi:hypothetical protein